MPIPMEEKDEIVKFYERQLDRYHNPLRAYEVTVKFLVSHKHYNSKDIASFFGKNGRDFL